MHFNPAVIAEDRALLCIRHVKGTNGVLRLGRLVTELAGRGASCAKWSWQARAVRTRDQILPPGGPK